MVRKTKINVVDLNEITAAPKHVVEHVATPEPSEAEITPEPIAEEEMPVSQEPPQDEDETKMKKGDEKATCAFCNKIMSVKALRYSHDKNCKGKKPQPEPVPVTRTATLREEPSQTQREKLQSSTSFEPILELPKVRPKMSRADIKQQRLNNLVSQAF